MHYLNIILVSSKTIPASIIRFFTKSKYNHAAISIDDNYSEYYSFARKYASSPLDGGFVKEKASYYSLGKGKDIDVKIFKLPITDEQLDKINEKMSILEQDKEYVYNFFSALLCPFNKGYKTYKAYYCSEFAANIINECTNIKLEKEPSKYSPADLCNFLTPYLWYEGPISKFTSIKKENESFYDKIPVRKIILAGLSLMLTLILRKRIKL